MIFGYIPYRSLMQTKGKRYVHHCFYHFGGCCTPLRSILAASVHRVADREQVNDSNIGAPVSEREEIAEMARSLEALLKKTKRLQELTVIDELTRVNNRRNFFELAEKEAKRAQRSQTSTATVMMLDIDHFKSINDTYGTDIGDSVLFETAQSCLRTIRAMDLFGRIGDEEFALVMPNTELEAGLAVAERIRKASEAQSLKDSNGNTVRATLSIGLTVADLAKVPFNTILKNADAALYLAKELGRNRVVVWDKPESGIMNDDATLMRGAYK